MRQDEVRIILKGLLNALRNEPGLPVYRPLPPAADPRTGVPSDGVGLRMTPRIKPVVAHPDWLEAKVAPDGPAFLEKLRANDTAVVIHWPTVLRTAWTQDTQVAAMARRLLRRLRVYYRESAPILSRYVELLKDQRFSDEALNNNLAVHVDALLRSPRGRTLVRELRRAVDPAVDSSAEKQFERCYACLQNAVELARTGHVINPEIAAANLCPACELRRDFAKECSVIDVKYCWEKTLAQLRTNSLAASKLVPEPVILRTRVGYDLVWFLAGLSDFDGAARNGRHLLVDWKQYACRLLEQGDHKYTCLDVAKHLEAAETDLNTALDSAAETLRDKVLKRLQPYDAVISDSPSETLFKRTALVTALENEMLSPVSRTTREAAQQLRMRELTGNAGPRKRVALQHVWESPMGPVDVALKRHGTRWSVCTPIPLAEGIEPPYRVLQRGREEVFMGEYWWYLEDLQLYEHSCRIQGHEETAEYLLALIDWFAGITAMYRKDPRTLLAAQQQQKLRERRSEMAAGQRTRLGKLTQFERDAVQRFCLERTETPCDRPFRGPFTDEEWLRLEQAVPFRSRELLLRCVNELGLEYAKQFGWVAYLKSGFGVRKNSLQRRNWMAMGVAV